MAKQGHVVTFQNAEVQWLLGWSPGDLCEVEQSGAGVEEQCAGCFLKICYVCKLTSKTIRSKTWHHLGFRR